MPTPKRWFPCSRDINDDPEVWELTSRFGDRALRLWLEVLAGLDKTDNCLRLSGDWMNSWARKVRQEKKTIQTAIQWMIEKGWLTVDERAADGAPAILSAPNYWKYHRSVERKQGPPFPNLPVPNIKENIHREKGIRTGAGSFEEKNYRDGVL